MVPTRSHRRPTRPSERREDRGLIFPALSRRTGTALRMGERADAGAASAPSAEPRGRRWALYAAAWAAGAVPLFALTTALWKAFPVYSSTGDLTIGAFALVFPVVVRRLGVPRREGFIRFLLVAGLAFGIVSVLTGWGNGLTDEPFTTPRFITLLQAHQDPYVVPLVFNYVQYGQTIHSYSIYPYLPLLMFLQIPGLDYKWFTLGCWVGMVLLVRRRFDAGSYLAQPYVVVMAASGYNDFPVLLLLTVAFVGVAGRPQRWAQLLALGAKQFANAIVLVYYLVRRDWKNVLVTLGVSAAFILPFVIWSGPVVLCPTVVADRLTSCPSGGTAQYLLNYTLWPIWVLAVFYSSTLVWARSASQKGRLSRLFAGRRFSIDDLLRTPAFAVVAVSGALGGVCTFLAVGIFLGSTGFAVIASAVVGFCVLAGWVVACDSAEGARGRLFGRELSRVPFQVAIQVVALALNTAAVGGAFLLGRPPLEGEFVGAFLACSWESVVIFYARFHGDPASSKTIGEVAPGSGDS